MKLRMSTITKASLAVVGLALTAAGVTGCRGERSNDPPRQFLPDMDDSPKNKPQTAATFFADGRAMRPRVPGTVAFGLFPTRGDESSANALLAAAARGRTDTLREDDGFYRGVDAKGQYLEKIPASVKVDQALLDRGMERFGIYCAPCHGYMGDGQGTVGVRWSGVVANFHDAKYFDATQNQGRDGYLFHTIRNGVTGAPDGGGYRMPAYGDKINERDAWAVVAWLRVLQETRRGTMDDVPADQRDAVRKNIEAAKAAAAKAASAAGGGK